jgi:ABC-type polysaccharide transport system permease subunit
LQRIADADLAIQKTFTYFFEKLSPAVRQQFILGLLHLDDGLLRQLVAMLTFNEVAFVEERRMLAALLAAHHSNLPAGSKSPISGSSLI